MKIYVAFRTDVEPNTKIASPSFTKLREELKGNDPGAEFTVVLFDFKPNVENLCKAIVDVTEIPADSATEYRINAQGQLREVK
jgi:hypothetical protein